MSQVEVTIPSVGESINEATIARWNYADGAWVQKDDVLFEIETDKASVEVVAPASGALQILAPAGQTVAIAAVVGKINTAASKPAGGEVPAAAAVKETKTSAVAAGAVAPATAQATLTPGVADNDATLHGLGPGARKAVREGKMPAPNTGGASGALGQGPVAVVERKKMTPIRKKIAERLMQSQQGTATLTTFNEVDMSAILAARQELKDSFQQKFGIKLGFMSFFTKAVCFAAQQVPAVNAYIEGDEIVYHRNVHTSVAVSTDRGLVVPVLRNADQLSYAGIEKGIADLADRARLGKLGIEEMLGGSFTITNGGVFGSLLSTPILNPPQSGILGMHKTEYRPMAIADANGKYSVEVRPMMYLALSYDHRIVDGRESVTFLVKVKEYLETVTAAQVMA